MAKHQSRLNGIDNAGNVGKAKLIYNQYRDVYPTYIPLVGGVNHRPKYQMLPGDHITFNGAIITTEGRFIVADEIIYDDEDNAHGQVGAWYGHL